MANYELSNLQYKGNTYIIKDNSALHQSAIGPWTPDFANLKPLATYEYDIASTSYFKICERPNVTSIKDITDEVLAFRITITGTNIFAIADVVAKLQPTVGQRPLVIVNYQTQSTSAGTTGIRYLRTVNPKAANTSYKYEIAIAAYNTTSRHIKLEVFKVPSAWTFSSTATAYSYNSTYQTAYDVSLYTNIGIIYNYPFYATATYANYAGYKSTWDGLFNGQGNFLNAGAAIAANQFVFIGKDNKVYPTTSTAVEIDPAWPISYCTTAVASGAAVTWSYLRSWGYFTPASSIGKDTLVADDTVYMRCTYTNGKLYSANTMAQTLTPGNTYIKLGKMYSATAVSVNTYNSEYFTLDTDGHIKALNGYLFNAAKADTANAVNRQFYIANANDYPILFDSNPTSDIVTATTIPSVTPALKYNPSTGNLTSGLFTGSGAGLTDIPLSGIQGGDELLPTKTLHVYHDLDNDTYEFTDSLTTQEIKDILGNAANGTINLQISMSDVDTSKLLKYFQSGNLFIARYLVFEDAPTIDMTTYQNHSLQSYFGIVWSAVSDNFQFASIPGDNLTTLSQQLMQLLAEKEDLSNKVTTIDDSSTNDQYPSAKAVYDIVPSKVDYSNTPFTGTCSTAAATMAKTVTVDSSFQLVDGVRVRVYMEKANTNSKPTLNVNGTGAKSIGIQGPYGALSDVALSAWYSGAFNRTGWFDFVYVASYNGGNGCWIIEDSPAPIRLANFVASSANRVTTINSTNGTLANGGVRYTVVANGATGNPFSGSAAVLWLNHDNTATYTRQIAMSANTPPHMAFRSQDSGGGTTWQPWEYVLTAANQYDSHMATLAYTAAGVAFSNNALTIPINGTQYKILQATVFNNDFHAGSLGYPALFSFNAAGSSGYIIGTTTYCVVRSAASGITLEFDSSWSLLSSTSVDVQVLYRRIS